MGSVKEILQTKITPPPLRADLISRPHMLKHLDRILDASEAVAPRLVMVSAPAGYGKTTLVREWIDSYKGHAAWYTLDSSGNETGCFWAYLIYALQKLQNDLGRGTLATLRSSTMFQETPIGNRELLTPLLNDLFHLDSPLCLVLDDYHLVNNRKIHDGMTYLVENMPPQLVLVVATRSEPPWPLARWRGKGRIVEVGHSELKFTRDETAAYLRGKSGRSLDDVLLDDLYQKTEGWVTALQLAVSSLRVTSDSGRLLSNIKGNHRQILSYLTEEVFSRQPQLMQEFLMKTSHLSWFSPSLCDRVTGRSDSRATLNRLAKNNLFIIPLDELGNWYRYHPLFAELLYYYLESRYVSQIPDLHEKTGGWFLEAGEPAVALQHFLKAGNYEQAAQILCHSFEQLLDEGGLNQCLEWLNCLPREWKEGTPRLLAYHALISLLLGNLDDSRASLKLVCRLGQLVEQPLTDYTSGLLALVRTSHHIFSGDLPAGLKQAEEALRLLPEDAYFWRISAAIVYGDVNVFAGDLEKAYAAFKDAYRWSRHYGNCLIIVSAAMNILKVLWMKGQLPEARRFAEEMLCLAKQEGFSNMPRMGVIWLFFGEILREEGNLEEAKRCVTRGISMCQPERMLAGVSLVFQVMVCFSKGEYREALGWLGKLENMEREDTLPEVVNNLLLAWKARILLVQGEVMAARQVLDQASYESLDTIFFPGGIQITHSRLLLAENRLEQAREAIQSIQSLPQSGASRRLMISTLLQQVLLEKQLGKQEAAEECLARALKLGKGSGFHQTFLDEGKDIAQIFLRIRSRPGSLGEEPGMDKYIQCICQGLQLETPLRSDDCRVAPPVSDVDYQDLVEDLSSRELEILALISRGLSNLDISRELTLSVRTVKWHNSNIFGKLGVSNRTQAVVRARELDILR